MDSRQYDEEAMKALRKFSYETAQVYATLSLAAAQREWNEMCLNQRGGATIKSS